MISRSPSDVCRRNPTPCHSCAALHETERSCSAAIWIGSRIALGRKVSKVEPSDLLRFLDSGFSWRSLRSMSPEAQLSPREDDQNDSYPFLNDTLPGNLQALGERLPILIITMLGHSFAGLAVRQGGPLLIRNRRVPVQSQRFLPGLDIALGGASRPTPGRPKSSFGKGIVSPKRRSISRPSARASPWSAAGSLVRRYEN